MKNWFFESPPKVGFQKKTVFMATDFVLLASTILKEQNLSP